MSSPPPPSSVSSIPMKPAALFWDLSSTHSPPDVNLVKLGYEALELSKALKPFKLLLARIYHQNNLSVKQVSEFSKLGFELCIQDPASKCPDYLMDIPMWFLDNRIPVGSTNHPASVIIINANSAAVQSLIQRLRQRGIHVMLISTKPFDGYIMDVDLFFNIEDVFQAARQSSYFVPNEKPYLYLSTSEETLSVHPNAPQTKSPLHQYRPQESPGNYYTPRVLDSFDFSNDTYEEFKSPRYRLDMNAFSQEEAALYSELYSAFQTRNTRVTVAVLRKIYTKQTRGFRIPDLLREVFPQIGENGIQTTPSASAYILFTLSCIQWALGMPTGEKPDSYKYKMNKNIARWLFKELQKKGIPTLLPSDVSHAVQSVVSNILELNIEADFSQDVSIAFGVPLTPRFPLSSPATLSVSSPHRGYEQNKFTFDGNYHPSNSVASTPRDRDAFAQINDLLATGLSIQQIHMAIPRMSVDHRLYLLVAKSPGGLLGARIPSLYREIYNERLRLQGRKLKDILLVSNLVEMIGSDGPGDKLFRLLNDPFANMNQLSSEQLGGSMDPVASGLTDFTSIGMHGHGGGGMTSEWNPDSSLFGRFRTFPRDEGSQLDKLIASLSLNTSDLPNNNDGDGDSDEGAEGDEREEIDYLRFQSFGMGQH